MQLSELPNDVYKGLIPIDPIVGKVHLYRIGLTQEDDLGIELPEHIVIAQRLGLRVEQVRGCYAWKRGDELSFHNQACGSVTRATEEIYRQALSNGVVILPE